MSQLITLEQTFPNMDEARLKIKAFFAANSSEVKVVKSNTIFYKVSCKQNNCPVTAVCNKRKDGLVYVTKLVLEHECSTLIAPSTVPNAYVVQKFRHAIQDNRDFPIAQMRNQSRREDGVNITYMQGWRGKRKLLNLECGHNEEGFQKINPFLERIEEFQPGTHTKFNVDSEGRFRRCFVCPASSATAFDNSLPVIVVDACTIKNTFKGVILVCCAIDGAGQIVPLAYALADIEDNANWLWFFWQLKEGVPSISTRSNLVLISDREKGIHNGAVTVFPAASHCYCVKHIEKNLKTKYAVGANFVQLLWSAAKTLNETSFDDALLKMAEINPEAALYLVGLPKKCWTRLRSDNARFGHVTSNVAESFNKWILEEREMPHFTILVSIYRKIMAMFYDRRVKYEQMTTLTTRTLNDELSHAATKSRTYYCIPSSQTKFLIQSASREYTVQLDLRKCCCGHFQDMLWPCSHAMAAIFAQNHNPLDYVADQYKRDCLKTLYSTGLAPVTIEDLSLDNTAPPETRTQAGRPRKVRLRNRSELAAEESPIICGKCSQRGHNQRTCERRQRINQV
jgi:hypothetical protein